MKVLKEQFWDYRFLLVELIKKGIRLKYRHSYLGILWSLLEPILTTIILSIVFGTLLGKSNDPTWPVYILTGRLLFSYFSQGTTSALKSIVANQGMIKKVYVPKYLFPLSAMLFRYIIFLISLIVLAGTMLIFKIRPTIYLLQIFIPLVNLLLLTIGCGMILATVGVFFRDMEYLWNVGTMLIMYMSAIFYEPKKILDSKFAFILKFNPVYAVISNLRSAVFGQPMDMRLMLYSFVFSVVSILAGSYFFVKKQDKFILYI
ncbi:MAG: ABC transporter permease [Clostridium sp.]|nr:ABC transporter permease [Clostridium sp.]MCM1547035.1 ABC transporter permease [Ruminococcus sp.]